MAYNYLGYGVTDENGVAKLDHDANGDPLTHSYTGVGAGEIDVLASLDNPITSSSIVSVPYSVLDAVFYDANGHTNTWTYTGMTVDTSNDEYTILKNETSSYKTYQPSISSFPSGDFIVEFKCLSALSTGCYLVCGDNFGLSTRNITTNDLVQLQVVNGVGKILVNGTQVGGTGTVSSPSSVRLQINQNGSDIAFKEFKVYQI